MQPTMADVPAGKPIRALAETRGARGQRCERQIRERRPDEAVTNDRSAPKRVRPEMEI